MTDIENATTDREAFFARFGSTLELGRKLKRAMLEKGKMRAWTKCPECGGKVTAVLAGRKNHIHMACDGTGCNVRMME